MTIPPIVPIVSASQVVSQRGKMPWTVIVLCVLYGLPLALSFYGLFNMHYAMEEITEIEEDPTLDSMMTIMWTFAIIYTLIQSLVFFGLVTGKRLAWYYYRTLGLLVVIIGTLLFGFSTIKLANESPSGLLSSDYGVELIYLILGWTIYFLLGTESARTFFGAICERCQSKRIKMLGFLAGSAKCRKCSLEWI